MTDRLTEMLYEAVERRHPLPPEFEAAVDTLLAEAAREGLSVETAHDRVCALALESGPVGGVFMERMIDAVITQFLLDADFTYDAETDTWSDAHRRTYLRLGASSEPGSITTAVAAR